MNEFEELQNLWQHQSEQKALPNKGEIIPQNTDNELVRAKNLLKRQQNFKWGATVLIVLGANILGFDIFKIGHFFNTDKSLNFLIMGILSGTIYLIWQNDIFTNKHIFKSNKEFLTKKISELKFQKDYLGYFLFFSETGLLLGVNWNWWTDFSFFVIWKRIFAHISISFGIFIGFEIIKALFVEDFEKETEELLEELTEIKKNLEEKETENTENK